MNGKGGGPYPQLNSFYIHNGTRKLYDGKMASKNMLKAAIERAN